jgi:hypothetical protein
MSAAGADVMKHSGVPVSHLPECRMLCLCTVNVDRPLVQGATWVQPAHCKLTRQQSAHVPTQGQACCLVCRKGLTFAKS